MNWMARAEGTSPISEGFRVCASASREKCRVPPWTGPDVDVLLPQAARPRAAVNDMTTPLSLRLGRNSILLESTEPGLAPVLPQHGVLNHRWAHAVVAAPTGHWAIPALTVGGLRCCHPLPEQEMLGARVRRWQAQPGSADRYSTRTIGTAARFVR